MTKRFLQRGGGWVIGQGILIAGVVSLGLVFRNPQRSVVLLVLGIVMLALGAAVGIAGAWALRRSLTPFPEPLPGARLVRNGIYAHIRHPLYTSVMMLSVGWSLAWKSWPAFCLALVLLPFFAAKAKREEDHLRKRFPDYANYASMTARFVPWVW